MRSGKELQQRQEAFREKLARKKVAKQAAQAQKLARYSEAEDQALNKRMWAYLDASARRLHLEQEFNRVHAIPTSWTLIEQAAKYHGLWGYQDSMELLGPDRPGVPWGRKKNRRETPPI